jgi:hypothetical protein
MELPFPDARFDAAVMALVIYLCSRSSERCRRDGAGGSTGRKPWPVMCGTSRTTARQPHLPRSRCVRWG